MPVSAERCTLSSPDNSCLALHHRARLGHVDVPRLVAGRVSTSPYLTVERKEKGKKPPAARWAWRRQGRLGGNGAATLGYWWHAACKETVARVRGGGGALLLLSPSAQFDFSCKKLLNKNWAGLVAGSKGSLGRERVAGVGCF